MAYITKRGSSYGVRYTYQDEHGKSCDKWESFSTKEEAINRKKQVEHELASGTFLIPSTVTVGEFLMDWLPKQCSKHKWAPKTYQSNLSTIQNLIVPYIGNMEMQKLKPYHLENRPPNKSSGCFPVPPSMRSTDCCTPHSSMRWSGASF